MKYPHKIKALVDYPNCGGVLKGEVGVHIKGSTHYYNFPSQNQYAVEMGKIGTSYEIVQEEEFSEPTYEIY